MEFDIKESEPREPSRPLRPPPDYTSRRTRIRLMFLVAALLLVLILMREAGKSENWEWINGNWGNQERISQTAPSSGDDADSQSSESTHDPDAALPGNNQPPQATSYREWNRQAWREVLGKLSVEEQQHVSLLTAKAVSNSLPPLNDSFNPQTLVDELDLMVNRRTAEELAGADFSQASDDHKKQQRSADLVRFRGEWSDVIKPALDRVASGEPASVETPEALRDFDQTTRDIFLDQVLDRTEMTRSADGPAWLGIWQRLLFAPPPSDRASVTHFDLMTQPQSYRGEDIWVEGEVRGINRISIAQNLLGIDHYFVLWIKPKELTSSPFCVYAARIPPEFGAVTGALKEVRIPVRVSGVFFKLRSYVTRNEKISMSPLILAGSIEVLPEVATASIDDSPNPSFVQGLLFVSILLVASLWIVVRTHRATKTRSPAVPKFRLGQIQAELDELTRDPTVATDRERIARFEKSQHE